MKRILLVFIATVAGLLSHAQLPPANLYENLAVYKSVAVYEDGEQIPFSGVDYFFLDFDSDGDVWIISWIPSENQWGTSMASLISRDYEGSKYEGQNGSFEDLIFLTSPDKRDLLVAKDGSDITVAYELVNDGASPSYGHSHDYTPQYGGGNRSYGESSGSSGRACVSCNGTGKCKTCDGKGWYYHETGYYIGRPGKTKTDCPVCRGTGRCGTCHGNGTIR